MNTTQRIQALGIGIVLALITACGSHTSVSTTPVNTSTTPAASTSASQSNAPAKVAHLGDTIEITSIGEESQTLAVTLLKVANNPKPGEFNVPDKGMRYMSVRFTIINKGPTAYTDSPWNGAQVADADGQRFGTMIADTDAGPSFPGQVALTAGSKATGWLTFQVPKTSVITSVQWGSDSGFGNIAEWQLS
jgi:hypothetical protein